MEKIYCEHTDLLIRKFTGNGLGLDDDHHILTCTVCSMALEIRKAFIETVPKAAPVRSEWIWYQHSIKKLLQFEKRQSSRQANISFALRTIMIAVLSALVFAGSMVSPSDLIFQDKGKIFSKMDDWWIHPLVWLTLLLSICMGFMIKRFFKIKM